MSQMQLPLLSPSSLPTPPHYVPTPNEFFCFCSGNGRYPMSINKTWHQVAVNLNTFQCIKSWRGDPVWGAES